MPGQERAKGAEGIKLVSNNTVCIYKMRKGIFMRIEMSHEDQIQHG